MAQRMDDCGHMAKRWAGALRCDERGSIAIMFAAALFVMGACVGCALDYGRWHSANSQMQLLLDNATLEAGRALQSSGSMAKASEVGERHFDRALAQKWFIEKKPPTFSVGSNGTAVTGRFDNAISSPFLSMIGITSLRVKLETRVDTVGAKKRAANPG
jgi:Putative Flp pilus-assembly TadE/G-like